MKKTLFVIPAGLAAIVLCAATAGAQTAAPHSADAPIAPNPDAAHKYTLSDAVPDAKGIHRMAILRTLDKITGRATDIAAPAGVPVRFGTLEITVRYCHTTPPEEPPETTAFLQIDEMQKDGSKKRLFSGWMFASSPALNPLDHPIYDVWVITCKTDEPAEPPSPPAASSPAAPPGAPADGAPASSGSKE